MPSPIRCATALSVMLHAAIILTLGMPKLRLLDFQSVPTMQFSLSLDDGRDLDSDSAPRTQHVIALGHASRQPSVAAVDDHPAEISPDPDTGKSEPPPPPSGTTDADDPLPPQTAVAEAAAAPTQSDEILTTSAESDFVVPASVPAAEPVTAPATISSAQKETMTRKVLRWAQGLQDAQETPSQLSWEQDGRVYTAVLKRRPAVSNTDIESALVEIVTVEDGKQLRTRLQLKRLAFSHYTQLVDRWDSSVQLHNDEVIGRFHSNTEITLGYDRAVAPRFLGKVTTAAGGFTIASWSGLRPRAEIFPAGLEIRVGRIALPQRFLQPPPNSALANAQFHTFDRDSRITFYSDGTYGWQRLGSSAAEERAPLGNVPMLMVGGRGAELHVRGAVNGNVLVYSPERILIDGNLVYAHNARLTPDAQDYLGLASDKYIDIARPDVTGPGDLEIDAAIYARRRFTVTEEATPGGGATLSIFGSLTAGTLSATEPRYATRVEFDSRFEHTRPPGFPMTNQYEVDQWDAQWQPASNSLN